LHHTGPSSSPYDLGYLKLMFNQNDSLFSEHFYGFCIVMMKNSGMMSTGGGMMGNNSNMMGASGGMMNGSTMGNLADMNKMMDFMDSIHVSTEKMMVPDYMNTDSLMYNQMSMCKMMTSQTDGIKTIFGNMQTLRKNHRALNGI
jgi:D-arabinose 1-dehydrogenase-like Zn-dependent alcohol dehydrogenase